MFSRTKKDSQPFGWLSFLSAAAELVLCAPGYETDERSSLGKRADRRRWREKGGERSAAVYIFKAALTAAENIGHRKPGCRTDDRRPSDQPAVEPCLGSQQCEPI